MNAVETYLKCTEQDLHTKLWDHVQASQRAPKQLDKWKLEGLNAIMVPHHHKQRRAIEQHVYFMPMIHPKDKGHIGNYDGIPVIVNTQLTRHTNVLLIEQVDTIGILLLGDLC